VTKVWQFKQAWKLTYSKQSEPKN